MNQIEKEAEAIEREASKRFPMYGGNLILQNEKKNHFISGCKFYRDHIAQQQADKMAVEWISVDEQNPPIKTYVDVWVEERKMSFMAYMDELFQWKCEIIDLSGFEIKYFKRRDFEPPKEKGYAD